MAEILRHVPEGRARTGRREVLRLAGAAALALVAPRARAAPPPTRFFRIGTGSTAGTYFPLGGELASALSDPPGSRSCTAGGSCGVPGLIAVAQATQGSVQNVEAVANGALESALCQADIAAWAYRGSDLFARRKPMASLRSLANLYTESVHIVVRADGGIDALKKLRGKRVSLGELESGTLADARLVLGTAGITEREIKGRYMKLTAAIQALSDGSLDAIFQIGGYPVPAIAELAHELPIRLVPVPAEAATKLARRYGYFTADLIPAGTYAGVAETVPTAGVGAEWIAGAELEPDFAYALVAALWNPSTRRLLDAGHPIGKRILLANATSGLGPPLHPGAERYYREMGLPIPATTADRN